jgi:hypothetical protein
MPPRIVAVAGGLTFQAFLHQRFFIPIGNEGPDLLCTERARKAKTPPPAAGTNRRLPRIYRRRSTKAADRGYMEREAPLV